MEKTEIRVDWDVTALDVDAAEVYLQGLDGTLFASGTATGWAETGEWVEDGFRFVLYLPEQRRVVAEQVFRILPCNIAEYPDED